MHGSLTCEVPGPLDSRPECADDEIVFTGIVLRKVVDVDPFGTRVAPSERQAFRDQTHAVAASDERIRLRELHANTAGEVGIFEKVSDAKRAGHQRFCAMT